jgi:hypothetical protein
MSKTNLLGYAKGLTSADFPGYNDIEKQQIDSLCSNTEPVMRAAATRREVPRANETIV